MNTIRDAAGVAPRATLPDLGVRALSAQTVMLVASAVALPALSHRLGLPVRLILPMHWAVLLTGLTYGWRAGAIVGVLAPGASFLVSGMPLPHILPAMTLELGAYGFAAGFARQIGRLSGVASTAVAIVAGRLVFVASAWVTGATQPSFTAYLSAALLPGVPAAIAQALLLPWVAKWWIRREGAR